MGDEKKELLEMFENGMTVGELIAVLSRFDKDLVVINTRGSEYFPVSTVEETDVDYCFDEVIKKHVVSVY